MKWIKTNHAYSFDSLATDVERDGQPYFFKHELPYFAYKDEKELQMAVSIYNQSGEYIDESEYFLIEKNKKIMIYHNLIDNHPYTVKYVMFPKTIAMEHEFYLNCWPATQLLYSFEVDNQTVTFNKNVYLTRHPFRKRFVELLYKNYTYAPIKYCVENGYLPEADFQQKLYTPQFFITSVVPEYLGDNLYKIDTRFLKSIFDPDIEKWNNLGYFYSKVKKDTVSAEFEVEGQIYPTDFRYHELTKSFGTKTFVLKNPLIKRTQLEKSASFGQAEMDYIPFDSLAPFEAGNINRVFTVRDLEKQLLATDKAIINKYKTSGIPEVNVDFAFNVITPDYIGRTTEDYINTREQLETEESRGLSDGQEIVAEGTPDIRVEFIHKEPPEMEPARLFGPPEIVDIKVNKVFNPGLLDLFVLDGSKLDKDEDYKEDFLWR